MWAYGSWGEEAQPVFGAALVTPNEHVLRVEGERGIERIVLSNQLVVVGALRAVMACELDQRGAL